MEAKTFEQCCDEIAKEHGFNTGWPAQQFWKAIKGKDAEIAYRRVCERYADSVKKAYAEQAVKADRKQIAEDYGIESVKNLPIDLP
ncbi:hypothetical protein [Dyadobacter sandarakinus]|uniref:Uncharacterized protein n=1 Tax=Dyadobacter sandarakinus TaxID=2747268 RepID=A0ABX7I108_9BACT|nr:hypothetical protein [Dyadobacter sandarakinus]QRQ99740.1 hypothetical protein HWI92_01810 [Dyadobacter sandarakinus]